MVTEYLGLELYESNSGSEQSSRIKEILASKDGNLIRETYEVDGKVRKVSKKEPGIIKEVYPIENMDGTPTGHYGIIFEADSKEPMDGAREAFWGRSDLYTKLKPGQKAFHISLTSKREVTKNDYKAWDRYQKCKEKLQQAKEGKISSDEIPALTQQFEECKYTTDWNYVTVPDGADVRNYIEEAIRADEAEKRR